MESDVKNLLKRYIDLHNRGGADELFADGVEIEVEGRSLSAPRRRAILRSFVTHQLVVDKIGSVGDDVAFATYFWRDRPGIGGLIRLMRQDQWITRLTLRPGLAQNIGSG